MSFIEVFVFSSTGQNVAASALGAVSKLTTTSGSNSAGYGNDLYADDLTAASLGWFANGGCATGSGTLDAWNVTFPGLVPVPIATVYYVRGRLRTRIRTVSTLRAPHTNSALLLRRPPCTS